MNTKIKILVLLIACFLVFDLPAQYQLTGKVLEAATGKAVAGSEVYNQTSGSFTTTDAQGRFVFDGLSAGSHEIIIFSFQYETLTDIVDIQADVSKEYQLEALQEDLSEVVILGKREELFALKKLRHVESTAIYAGKKTEVIVMDMVMGNRAANNSRQIYAQIAGLNIYEGNDAGLQLGIGGRGLDPNRSANFNTRQNGYDISADVLGYPESYYTPPAEALQEIQIIRGAASLQYGSQFGGLVNFKIRKPPLMKGWEVNTRQSIGSFGLFNSYNSIGGNFRRFSFFSYYHFKRGDGYRDFSAFDAHNGYIYGQYRLGERSSLSGEFSYFHYLSQQAGGLTDAQFAENPRQSTRKRNWFEVDWKVYNLQFNHKFNANTEFTLSAFGLAAERNALGFRGNPVDLNANPITALDEQRSDGSYLLPRDLIRGTFNNWGLEARWLTRYKIQGRQAIALLGGKYYDATNTSVQGAGSTDVDPDFSFYNDRFPDYANQSDFRFPNRNVALFGEHIFYLTEKLTLTPGVRFEFINTQSMGTYRQVVFDNAGNAIANQELTDDRQLSRSFVLFGLGLAYDISRQLELYGNFSQNYRSVTFSDIRVVNPTFIIDPDISDERGFTADLGLRGRLDRKVAYDLGAYTLFYDDRIGIILDERANRVRKNIGRAVIAGVESLVDVNIGKILYPDQRHFKFSWFANTAVTYARYLASEENNVVGKRVEFVPAFNLKTGLKGGYKNLLVSAQLTHLSEQYTDVQNSATPPAGDQRSGIIGTIPAYQVMDISLSYQWKSLRVESGINNLLDEAYFTRRATGYPGPGIIPSDGRSFYLTLGYTF